MAERSLRGMSIGAKSLESDDNVDFAARNDVAYVCPKGHRTILPFAEGAEIPDEWECRCGSVAHREGDADREGDEISKPTRTHWDMLLERRSIENARRLGVQFVQTEAVGLTWTDRLTVETLAGAYPADAVILATGASRAVPRIPGLTGLEGHGVSWCAACDAFFYRGKDVAVLGSGEYALHEVQALLPVVKSVTLLTDGAALTADFPPEVTVCTQKVEAILGEQTVTGVQLAGGAVREVSGVFVALGVAGSTALARKIGAAVEGSRIVVDEKMQTTVPGLYAAGDCTGGLLQVAKAVYEGAQAGTEAAKALRKG